MTWTRVSEPAFGNTSGGANRTILAMTVFNGQLYATASWFESDPGKQIWRSASGDPATWSRVVSGGNGVSTNNNCSGFQPFDSYLYAAIENKNDGVQVWRTADGVTWMAVATEGLGDTTNYNAGGLAVFDGALYFGTSNDAVGGQLWRSQNGTTWIPVGAPGMGDSRNSKPDGVISFGGQLYVFESNGTTGIEAWCSPDGTHWTQINPDGFGDSSNSCTLWSSGLANYRGHLYVGSADLNCGLGKVWQLQSQTYLPLVLRH